MRVRIFSRPHPIARALLILGVAAGLAACPADAEEPLIPRVELPVPPDIADVLEGDDGHDMGGDIEHDMDGDIEPLPLPAPKLEFEEITLDIDPLAITEVRFIPGRSDAFLVLTKVGRIHQFQMSADGNSATSLGSFDVPDVNSEADCGLISLAFSPDWATATAAHFYVGHCVTKTANRITRLTWNGAAALDATVAATAVVFLEAGDPDAVEPWHNIGAMGFDETGALWALFGEKAVGANAQDSSNLLGGVIRVMPSDAGVGLPLYTVLPGGPFSAVANAKPELWAMGLRSPWRGALDAMGRLWIGDVGPAKIEEVNIMALVGGENFGWPLSEGPCVEGDCSVQHDPTLWWDRGDDHPFALDDDDTAPTSRRVAWVGLEYQDPTTERYDGRMKGWMLYGDFCAGWVRGAQVDAAGALTRDAHFGHLEGVVSWDQSADGWLYAATYGNCHTFPYKTGRIWRAIPAAPQ